MKKLDDLSVLVPENEDIIGRGHPRRFDWRGAWNRSLRFRLLALGMMPLLMAFPLVMAALSILGGDRAEEMLLANLRGQLGASSTYLEQTRRQTGQQLGQLVRSERIAHSSAATAILKMCSVCWLRWLTAIIWITC